MIEGTHVLQKTRIDGPLIVRGSAHIPKGYMP
jgi:hypothetical protein